MKGRRTFLIAPVVAVAVVVLAVAGCGSSSDDVKAGPPAASANESTPGGAAATVGVDSGDLGNYLVDSQGRTLYLFEKDKGMESTCSGACAQAWPPSTTNGRPKAGSDVDRALLGTTTRSDGKSQLTYNGHPLYRYAGDRAPGDTKGQDLTQFGGGWYVVSPAGQQIEGHETSSSTSGGGYGY